MPAITTSMRTVFYATTKGRSYMSLRSAASAEAGARIEKKYPTERAEYEGSMCYYGGFYWQEDERLVKVHKRYTRLIMRAAKPQPDQPAQEVEK